MKSSKKQEKSSQRFKALEKMGMLYTPAEERFDRITRLACKIFNVPYAMITLIAKNSQWFKSSQGLLINKLDKRLSFCSNAILMDKPLIIEDTLKDPRFSGNKLVTDAPCIRFYAGQVFKDINGIKLGTLCIYGQKPKHLTPSEIETLIDMTAWVENEMKVKQLSKVQRDLINDIETVKREALLDSLTQLWNRKAIVDILGREIERSKRSNEPISLFMIDIDHFKKINDTYGHLVGDFTLKEVANRMRRTVRQYDAIGRYGGEEFLEIASNCDTLNAEIIAEKIRKRIYNEPFTTENLNINVSISVGAASFYPSKIDAVNELIHKADSMLYKAKNNGRNRSEISHQG